MENIDKPLTKPDEVLAAIFHSFQGCDADDYDKWSDLWDQHMEVVSYASYKVVVESWRNCHESLDSSIKHKVFDAGCGTGLIGVALSEIPSFKDIELYGGDYSAKMLEATRSKNLYTDVQFVNLKEKLPYGPHFFDSALSSGVFAPGHCGPECIPNIMEVLKPGCVFIITVRKDWYLETVQGEFEKQIQGCNSTLVEKIPVSLLHGSSDGLVLVIKKNV